MISGIYKITNPKGRTYIGQSININKRFKGYRSSLYNSRKQVRLSRSFKKHGIDNHIFEILEECNLSVLNERERYWQEKYKVLSRNGLNCLYQSYEGRSGKMSEESKKKVSISKKGCKAWNKGLKMNKGSIRAQEIIDVSTGEIFKNIKLASDKIGMNRTTLNAMLSGQNRNKTSMMYNKKNK